jgi:hypothetical protein
VLLSYYVENYAVYASTCRMPDGARLVRRQRGP